MVLGERTGFVQQHPAEADAADVRCVEEWFASGGNRPRSFYFGTVAGDDGARSIKLTPVSSEVATAGMLLIMAMMCVGRGERDVRLIRCDGASYTRLFRSCRDGSESSEG